MNRHCRKRKAVVVLLLLTMIWPLLALGEETDPFFVPSGAEKAVSFGYAGVDVDTVTPQPGTQAPAVTAEATKEATPTSVPSAAPEPVQPVASIPALMPGEDAEEPAPATEDEQLPEAEEAHALAVELHAPETPVLLGTAYEISASVTPSIGLMGQMVFTQGENRTAVPIVDGTATLRFVPMAMGTFLLRAQYSPAEGEALTSNVAEAEITYVHTLPQEGMEPGEEPETPAIPLAVRLQVADAFVTEGESTRLTADVWSADISLDPAGMVTFFEEGVAIGSAPVAEGTSSLNWMSQASGERALTAAYTPAVGENYICTAGEAGVTVVPAGAVSILSMAGDVAEEELSFHLEISGTKLEYGEKFTVKAVLDTKPANYVDEVAISFNGKTETVAFGEEAEFVADDVGLLLPVTAISSENNGEEAEPKTVNIGYGSLTIEVTTNTQGGPTTVTAKVTVPDGMVMPDLTTFVLSGAQNANRTSLDQNSGVIEWTINGNGRQRAYTVSFPGDGYYYPAIGSFTTRMSFDEFSFEKDVNYGEESKLTISLTGTNIEAGSLALYKYGKKLEGVSLVATNDGSVYTAVLPAGRGSYQVAFTTTATGRDPVTIYSSAVTHKVNPVFATGTVTIEDIAYGDVPTVKVALDAVHGDYPSGTIVANIEGTKESDLLDDGGASFEVEMLLPVGDVSPTITYMPLADEVNFKDTVLSSTGFTVSRAEATFGDVFSTTDGKNLIVTVDIGRAKPATLANTREPGGEIELTNGVDVWNADIKDGEAEFTIPAYQIANQELTITYDGDACYEGIATPRVLNKPVTGEPVTGMAVTAKPGAIDSEQLYYSEVTLSVEVSFADIISDALKSKLHEYVSVQDEKGNAYSGSATYSQDGLSATLTFPPYTCDAEDILKTFTATFENPMTIAGQLVSITHEKDISFTAVKKAPALTLTLGNSKIYYGQKVTSKVKAVTPWGNVVTSGQMHLEASESPLIFTGNSTSIFDAQAGLWQPSIANVALNPGKYSVSAVYTPSDSIPVQFTSARTADAEPLEVKHAPSQVSMTGFTGNWRDGYVITAHVEGALTPQITGAQTPKNGKMALFVQGDDGFQVTPTARVTVDSRGNATFYYKGSLLDGKQIRLMYEGDDWYSQSGQYTSSRLSDPFRTVTLTTSPATSQIALGTYVTLTAEINPNIVSGSEVAFYDNGVKLAGTVSISGNKATLTVRPTLGEHVYTAQYNAVKGDQKPYISAKRTHTVGRATPAITLAATAADVGATLSVRLDQISGGAVPTGDVVFTYGDTVIGTVALDITGRGYLTWKEAPKGKITVAATYQGNTYYGVVSAFDTVTVTATAAKSTSSSKSTGGDPYTVSSIADNDVPLAGTSVRLLNQEGAQLEQYVGTLKSGSNGVLPIQTKARRTQYTYELSLSAMRALAVSYPQGYYDIDAGDFSASVPFALYNGLPGLSDYLRTNNLSRDALKLRLTFERVDTTSTEAALSTLTEGSTLASTLWRVSISLYDARGPLDYKVTGQLSTPIKLRFATSEQYPYGLFFDPQSDTIQLPLAEKSGGEAAVQVLRDGEYGLVVDRGMG